MEKYRDSFSEDALAEDKITELNVFGRYAEFHRSFQSIDFHLDRLSRCQSIGQAVQKIRQLTILIVMKVDISGLLDGKIIVDQGQLDSIHVFSLVNKT